MSKQDFPFLLLWLLADFALGYLMLFRTRQYQDFWLKLSRVKLPFGRDTNFSNFSSPDFLASPQFLSLTRIGGALLLALGLFVPWIIWRR